VNDIPFDVDLAVMLIPAASVPAAVAACVQKGVKGIVISSEGFAETGTVGAVTRRRSELFLSHRA